MIKPIEINTDFSRRRIFISPLDWGLGHATRCIPIIKSFIEKDFKVFIGADKATYALLKNEFPQLNFIKIKGYDIKYSTKKGCLYLKLLTQLPRIFTVIRSEKKHLAQIIKDYSIDAVVSDNRFGLYSKKIPCIYITHQLALKTGNIFSDKLASIIHRYFIKKFSFCWIPDYAKNGLAGALSHPKKLIPKARYLGALSRFVPMKLPKLYDLLISISGPEPQRTIFENLLLKQCTPDQGKILFIRGLPGKKEPLDFNEYEKPNLTAFNHLSAEALNRAFCQAEMVIARSGYTTIMDLAKLQKKAILIPTPGQTEQEYLANHLMEKKYFFTETQFNFNLETALAKVKHFNFVPIPPHEESFLTIINEFATSLKRDNFAT